MHPPSTGRDQWRALTAFTSPRAARESLGDICSSPRGKTPSPPPESPGGGSELMKSLATTLGWDPAMVSQASPLRNHATYSRTCSRSMRSNTRATTIQNPRTQATIAPDAQAPKPEQIEKRLDSSPPAQGGNISHTPSTDSAVADRHAPTQPHLTSTHSHSLQIIVH